MMFLKKISCFKMQRFSKYNYILHYLSFGECANLFTTVLSANYVIMYNTICIYTMLFQQAMMPCVIASDASSKIMG